MRQRIRGLADFDRYLVGGDTDKKANDKGDGNKMELLYDYDYIKGNDDEMDVQMVRNFEAKLN